MSKSRSVATAVCLLLLGVALFTASPRARAQDAPSAAATQQAAQSLPGIIVTGVARSRFDVPASISSVSLKDATAAGKNIQLSEYLRQVPGGLAFLSGTVDYCVRGYDLASGHVL